MKCEITEKREFFVPKQVLITLETEEEECCLDHLFGCWNSQELCIKRDSVREMARVLVTELRIAGIHS